MIIFSWESLGKQAEIQRDKRVKVILTWPEVKSLVSITGRVVRTIICYKEIIVGNGNLRLDQDFAFSIRKQTGRNWSEGSNWGSNIHWWGVELDIPKCFNNAVLTDSSYSWMRAHSESLKPWFALTTFKDCQKRLSQWWRTAGLYHFQNHDPES